MLIQKPYLLKMMSSPYPLIDFNETCRKLCANICF